jgi:DinB superfamily
MHEPILFRWGADREALKKERTMRYLALETAAQEELMARLEQMPGFLETAFGALSASEAVVRASDGTFAPVEQCWHLADLEREGFLARIGRLLREDDPELPDFDGARVAEERRYLTLSLAEGLAAFRRARAQTIELLRTIQGETWTRRGRQEGVGEVALCDIPAMIAEHDASHRREIEAWVRGRRG